MIVFVNLVWQIPFLYRKSKLTQCIVNLNQKTQEKYHLLHSSTFKYPFDVPFGTCFQAKNG